MKDFIYNIEEDLGIFDEKGSMFLALRKVGWGDHDAKLELRKWNINAEGKETPNKGFSFLTENGPDELVNLLLKNDYGNTMDIIEILKDREDFNDALDINIGGYSPKGDLYDPTEALFVDKKEVAM